jgi:hypothetical protein
MRRLKNDQTLAGLPAPVSLMPDQLAAVAAGTAATLAVGLGRVIIAGGMPAGPIYGGTSFTAI